MTFETGRQEAFNLDVERTAYKDVLDFGGLLKDLIPAKVSNLDNAVLNAREFTAEVAAKLKAGSKSAWRHNVGNNRTNLFADGWSGVASCYDCGLVRLNCKRHVCRQVAV
ncbi:hypothetical protein ACWGS9_32015 [Bradyrhizobium sp. Arg314]